jgi:tRNA threonylcarbamoyl adenosine modification protein YjeE
MSEIKISSEEELNALSKTLVQAYLNAVKSTGIKRRLFVLSGEMGAGKTTFVRQFVRALCEAIKVPQPWPLVISPTYQIENRFTIEAPTHHYAIVHFDLYRMTAVEELDALDFSGTVNQSDILFIEWLDRFPLVEQTLQKEYPQQVVKLKLRFDEYGNRYIVIS